MRLGVTACLGVLAALTLEVAACSYPEPLCWATRSTRNGSAHHKAEVVVNNGYLRADFAVNGATAGRDFSIANFSYSTYPCVCGIWHRSFGIPLWTVGGLLAAYPLISGMHRALRRRRRRLRGWCLSCGYDLQLLTCPRCPECGRPIVATGESSPRRLTRIGLAIIVGTVVMAATIAVPLPSGTDLNASPKRTTRGIPLPFLRLSPNPNTPEPWEVTTWGAGAVNAGFWICLAVALAVAGEKPRRSSEEEPHSP